jgi:hypothetical protein
MNPRGHKEDLGHLSHSKSQHNTTNSHIFDLSQETLENLTLGRRRKMRVGERGEETRGLPSSI